MDDAALTFWKMKPLDPPDCHFLSAAVGWLELGDHNEALAELDKIGPDLQHHPGVLFVRYDVCAKAKKWNLASAIALELVQINPNEAQFWIWHAYATRRMTGGGIPQAREILDKAQHLIPEEPMISYNLSCYECQLGNLEAARKWLERTFNLDQKAMFKNMAREDHDLEPLWPEIKEMST